MAVWGLRLLLSAYETPPALGSSAAHMLSRDAPGSLDTNAELSSTVTRLCIASTRCIAGGARYSWTWVNRFACAATPRHLCLRIPFPRAPYARINFVCTIAQSMFKDIVKNTHLVPFGNWATETSNTGFLEHVLAYVFDGRLVGWNLGSGKRGRACYTTGLLRPSARNMTLYLGMNYSRHPLLVMTSAGVCFCIVTFVLKPRSTLSIFLWRCAWRTGGKLVWTKSSA
jgi:hypothetical protein